jgi:CHAT domain-containing protein
MLRSASLRANNGLKAMCRARAPFVFINACSTGQRVPSLVGGAGFPLAFGDIGARAILAPLWPVESDTASKIAVELYQTALQPGSPPVAEILRKMRNRAYAEQDADSYAAYAFFGDPTARLELVS